MNSTSTVKRFSTSQGEVVATLRDVNGSTRGWALTVDGVRVGYVERAGSSRSMRTVVGSLRFGRSGTYLGTFERCCIEIALCGLEEVRRAAEVADAAAEHDDEPVEVVPVAVEVVEPTVHDTRSHNATSRVVGYSTPRTHRPTCRACGWSGSNTTSKRTAERDAIRHNDTAAPIEVDVLGRVIEPAPICTCASLGSSNCGVHAVASRSYTVGLPVTITVADDGTVTYTVDTSEAGQAIREVDDSGILDDRLVVSDAQVERDADTVDAVHERDAVAVVRAPIGTVR